MIKVNFEKVSLHTTPEGSLGYLLWRVSTQWRGIIEGVLKPLDLTHPQFVVLATCAWLTKDSNRVSQIEIGKMANLDPNTTSQILRGLEAKDFITRIRADERSKNPILTVKGYQVLQKALPAVEKADQEFFKLLNSQQANELVKLIKILIR